MIALSTRTKEAIKVALAMVIVYSIAMQMGYQNDLVKIPTKLTPYAKQIDYRLFPETTPEQV